MNVRDLTYEAGWLTLAGLLVSFHRLAVGFYLSDAGAEGVLSIALVVLGGLSAIVLTGAQMLLAATLATVRDRLLELAWWTLLVCAVIVMSASTLASMHGASLAEVLEPEWLAARLPAVVLSVGLSLAIEISLAAIRRASALLSQAQEATPLHLAPHEAAELEVQAELARRRDDSTVDPESVEVEATWSEPTRDESTQHESAEPVEPEDVETEDEPEGFTETCPYCDWSSATWEREIQAKNALHGHLGHCVSRP